MLPKSDDLEELYRRAKASATTLGKMGGNEVKKQSIKDELADIARSWLKISPIIREAGCCKSDHIQQYDQDMTDLLSSTTQRARASALKKKLRPFVDGFVDSIIVPVIQIEGSPRHVAARQVQEAFEGALSTEEIGYVEEAARCVTIEGYRAAIIMLWAAAIARLHRAVQNRGFAIYNDAIDSIVARKGAPFNRIKPGAKLTSFPELQRSRDADLLIVGMEVFGYDLQCYQELDRLLGQRNDCAHPGMNHPGALDVQQFATKVRRFVFDHVTI